MYPRACKPASRLPLPTCCAVCRCASTQQAAAGAGRPGLARDRAGRAGGAAWCSSSSSSGTSGAAAGCPATRRGLPGHPCGRSPAHQRAAAVRRDARRYSHHSGTACLSLAATAARPGSLCLSTAACAHTPPCHSKYSWVWICAGMLPTHSSGILGAIPEAHTHLPAVQPAHLTPPALPAAGGQLL